MLPGWAKGAAQILSWLIWGPEFVDGKMISAYQTPMGGLQVFHIRSFQDT